MRLLAALVLSLALAAPAHAATTTTRTVCLDPRADCYDVASFVAEPGEANRLTASDVGAAVIYHDAGAPVRAQGRCVQVDEHTTRCPAAYGEGDTGDGDDVARGNSAVGLGPGEDRAEMDGGGANGGPGNDVLLGGARGEGFDGGEGDDVIVAGGGEDALDGGPGRDVLDGGRGPDRIRVAEENAPQASDTVDGGPGRDEASWVFATRPVAVDLADDAPDGDPIAPETLKGIEDVAGGRGADRIYGDDGPNGLQGGTAGPDVVVGRRGDDHLFTDLGGRSVQRGGRGDDRLYALGLGRLMGGPGDDHLTSTYGVAAAETHCGAGDDLLTTGDFRFALRGCERVEWYEGDEQGRIDVRPAVSAGRAAFLLRCYRECRAVLELRDARGRLVARRRFRSGLGTGPRSRVAIGVPPAVGAALRSRRGWSGRVGIRLRIDGHRDRVAFHGRLRAR